MYRRTSSPDEPDACPSVLGSISKAFHVLLGITGAEGMEMCFFQSLADRILVYILF